MVATLSEGVRLVRGRPARASVLAAGAIAGLASEGFDRLGALHLIAGVGLPALGRLDAVVWFGVIDIGGLNLGIGAAEVLRHRVDLGRSRAVARALLALHAALVVAMVAFGLAKTFAVAVVAFLAAGLLRGLADPLTTVWTSGHAAPGVRATVLSLGNQLNALGQIAGGPAVDRIGNTSVRGALVLSGLLIVPTLPLPLLAYTARRAATLDAASARTAT